MIIHIFVKFHDFFMHGTFSVIFQIFHGFQNLWKPCNNTLELFKILQMIYWKMTMKWNGHFPVINF